MARFYFTTPTIVNILFARRFSSSMNLKHYHLDNVMTAAELDATAERIARLLCEPDPPKERTPAERTAMAACPPGRLPLRDMDELDLIGVLLLNFEHLSLADARATLEEMIAETDVGEISPLAVAQVLFRAGWTQSTHMTRRQIRAEIGRIHAENERVRRDLARARGVPFVPSPRFSEPPRKRQAMLQDWGF